MVELAKRWARWYVEHGMNPLPSREDRKAPALRKYAQYLHGEPIPFKFLEKWWSPNIQVCLGAAWRLCVVDVDGRKALDVVSSWERQGLWPRTWVVFSGVGRHYWFRLPEDLTECRSRKLWLGKEKHEEIQLLGDGALIVAPPSRHVRYGGRYRFIAGPVEFPQPALPPGWLLEMGDCREPPRVKRPQIYPPRGPRTLATVANHTVAQEMIDAIDPERKLDLVENWGLRLKRRVPNAAGWVPCKAVDREDKNPSASFCPRTGVYWEPGRPALGFTSLAVVLGAYPDGPTAYRAVCGGG